MPPNQPPPPRYDGTPHRLALPVGTTLTRIHSDRFDVTEYNPTVARSGRRGGRFDSTPDDEYAFLYAAGDDATAISEVLLRNIESDERGSRSRLSRRLDGLRIGWIQPTRELELVNLRSGMDLAAIGQDTWLTMSDDYAMTRRWASAIREWAPWAHGLTWRSRREPDGFAYLLFADRCPDGCIEEATHDLPLLASDRDLASGDGRTYLERLLARYRVRLV